MIWNNGLKTMSGVKLEYIEQLQIRLYIPESSKFAYM